MKAVFRCPTPILFLLPLICLPSFAQTPKNILAGTVLSAWESPVPDAVVTLSNRQGGAKATATTDLAGDYHFPTLSPGSYDLSVEVNGYQPYRRLGIQINTTPARKDIRLQPAKEDYAAAIKQWEAAVAAKPDDYIAKFNLGRVYFASGNAEKAADQFMQSLRLHSEYFPALMGLTEVALRSGNAAKGLQFAQAMVRLHPASSSAKLQESVCLLRLGRFDDAREGLTGLLKNDPDDAGALLELGTLELVQKQYRDAQVPLRRAYDLDPSDLRGIDGVAEAHLQMNEPDKAVQVVAAEVDKEPQRRDLHKLLAAIQARAKQYDKAIAGYQSLLAQGKDAPAEQADLYARIADAYAKSDQFQPAADNLKKASELMPQNAAYVSTLASLCDRAGKKQDAIAAYRAALKLQPGSAAILNNLAYLLADTGGDLDEALSMAQLARREQPELNEILDTIGWIYLKKSLVDSATRVFADLVEKYSTNSTYHYHYAVALAKKGDKAAALKELNTALENKPSKAEEALIREMVRKLS